jgi:8-oxo-dGTP pyrophosphatase MutT (NUDIX family)
MLVDPSAYSEYNIPFDLKFYSNTIKPIYNDVEWGFPKGRRDKKNEENIKCACREFEEETGYVSTDYVILNKISPIEEKMTGTNGIKYKHIYYLAVNNRGDIDIPTNYDMHEIGDIKWFTYDEAFNSIREYHVDKRKILTSIYTFILNYLIHHNINI